VRERWVISVHYWKPHHNNPLPLSSLSVELYIYHRGQRPNGVAAPTPAFRLHRRAVAPRHRPTAPAFLVLDFSPTALPCSRWYLERIPLSPALWVRGERCGISRRPISRQCARDRRRRAGGRTESGCANAASFPKYGYLPSRPPRGEAEHSERDGAAPSASSPDLSLSRHISPR